jgi:alcohol dehydrogenase, propanol-preferring
VSQSYLGKPLRGSGAAMGHGERSVYGSLTGTAIDNKDTLAFSVQENIRPMIETVPLEQEVGADARMMGRQSGAAWHRLQRTERLEVHSPRHDRRKLSIPLR